MKLEQQVCSLELAKRLKELGVKQESIFAYSIDNGQIIGFPTKLADLGMTDDEYNWCSAFTVAELINLLDEEITIPKVENVADYIAEKLCLKLMQK